MMGQQADKPDPDTHPCYWLKEDDGSMILIPGCWSRANHPDHCSCDVSGSRIERERAKRRAAEARAERLAEKLFDARAELDSTRLYARHWLKVLRAQGIDPSKHNPK
ncbi:hypothetical protein [Paracoccus sp. ME4]|uniref:hypothetical protein n=1 Tax=Paracoccus sp. ME4 TaxID=3138066 RepID=UPI00398B1307